MTNKWTEANIPDQTGRVAIVTGANSGIGYDTARALAQHGATVVMACRNMQKANPAADAIRALNPSGSVVVMALDLMDLGSVRGFAGAFRERYERLDLLINNAGIMATPYNTTKDGFESQLGVNHLAHFALTGLLLDMLNATPNARVVNVSSMAHTAGQFDFNNLQMKEVYSPFGAYSRSKLANLLFTYEMQRRLAKSNSRTIATAAHPGGTNTNLGDNIEAWYGKLLMPLFSLVMQSSAMGALPTLRAAVDPAVKGGDYYGPDSFQGIRGHPVVVTSTKLSHDQATAQKLWDVSEELTKVTYDFA